MRRKRLALGVLVLAVLAVTAGCTSPFGSAVDEESLDENATYKWDSSADVYVNVSDGQYHAVFDVRRYDEEEFEIWQPGIDSRNPVSISALRFRYPNGTTVRGSDMEVGTSGGATVVSLPDSEGKLAFTAETGDKSLVMPSYMEGSYHVVLPEGMRVSFPLFGRVSPGADTRTLSDDRIHLRWNELSRTLNVDWYLERDVWLFAGLVAILGVIGAVGVAYYLYQIRQLERQREDLGLDMSDDDGRDPPPGMG